MLLRGCAVLGCLLIGVPVAVSGQSSNRLPRAGQTGLFFNFPDGGGAGFGMRKMLSRTTNAGLGLQFSLSHQRATGPGQFDNSHTSWSIGVSPDLRLYQSRRSPVVPFLALNAQVGYTHIDQDTHGIGTGAGVGIGAEWFPTRSMSVSGSTGITATYDHQSHTDVSADNLSINLFRSQLTLNLYFR